MAWAPRPCACARRGGRPGHHDQVPARRRRHRPRHHDQIPTTLNEQCRGQRPMHHVQVTARRRGHRPGHHGQVLSSTHYKRRREQRPGHHDEVPREPKRGRGRSVCAWGPSLLAVFINVGLKHFIKCFSSAPSTILVFSTCTKNLSSHFFDLEIKNPLGRGYFATIESSLWRLLLRMTKSGPSRNSSFLKCILRFRGPRKK
jgi:hypothetical protein